MPSSMKHVLPTTMLLANWQAAMKATPMENPTAVEIWYLPPSLPQANQMQRQQSPLWMKPTTTNVSHPTGAAQLATGQELLERALLGRK